MHPLGQIAGSISPTLTTLTILEVLLDDMNRIAGAAASLAALVSLIIGVAATKWYVWDIGIEQAGQPDRSMLFWGLPILFIGFLAIGAFVALVIVARNAFGKR